MTAKIMNGNLLPRVWCSGLFK